MIAGDIFDIKKYAIHDGPGIRTTIFLKGCPLSCRWCHNPEGIETIHQRYFRAKRCIGCLECESNCPENALFAAPNGLIWDASRCRICRTCERACPSEAVTFVGKTVSAENIMTEIVKDTLFYDESGGGVTFSGGEPLMQPAFLEVLLKETGKLGLHRTVDTSGHTEFKTLCRVAAHTDLFLYDLKHMDEEKHRDLTGVSNEKILNNLRQLDRLGNDIIVRIPVIPGVNCDDKNISETGAFAASLSHIKGITLLPYHRAGANKYHYLGQPDRFQQPKPISGKALDAIFRKLKTHVRQVQIGG